MAVWGILVARGARQRLPCGLQEAAPPVATTLIPGRYVCGTRSTIVFGGAGGTPPYRPASLLAADGYNAPMNALPSDLAHPNTSPGRSLAALAGWLLLTYSASATAVFVSTGGWYSGLAKPTWNPPGWIFGPVWSISYSLRENIFRQGCN